jgi:ribosomal protein S18 acetylase RimI-like enzyme
MITVRPATKADHATLCKIAKQSKYTSSFSSMMFSGDVAYEKGWITVAEDNGVPVGLLCIRHKVREPKTIIYFMVTDHGAQCCGAGAAMLDYLKANTPHPIIELSVMKDNAKGLRFWTNNGFVTVGEAYEGKGLQMEWHKEITQ